MKFLNRQVIYDNHIFVICLNILQNLHQLINILSKLNICIYSQFYYYMMYHFIIYL